MGNFKKIVWEKIYKEYPKAFDLFFKWHMSNWSRAHSRFVKVEINREGFLNTLGSYRDIRNLYEFFDKQGIVIKIDVWPLYDFFDEEGVAIKIDWPHGKENVHFNYVIFEIIPDGGTTHDNSGKPQSFELRPEAEEQAFLKAFELLQKQSK